MKRDPIIAKMPINHYGVIIIGPSIIFYIIIKKLRNYIFKSYLKFGRLHSALIMINLFQLIFYLNLNYFSDSNLKSKLKRFIIP